MCLKMHCQFCLFRIFQFAIVLGLLFTGCATRGDVEHIITDLDTMKKDYGELHEKSAAQDSLWQEQAKVFRNNYADISYRLDQLAEHLRLIENKLDDLQSRQTGQGYPYGGPQMPAGFDSTADSLKSKVEISAKRIYDTAYMDFIKGDYKVAITGFDEYLKQNPKTPLSDNAEYFIGECHFNLSDYDQAAATYTSLLKERPKSEKAPDALLRMVELSLKKSDPRAASRYYEKLAAGFPDSPQAERAKDLIRKSKRKN